MPRACKGPQPEQQMQHQLDASKISYGDHTPANAGKPSSSCSLFRILSAGEKSADVRRMVNRFQAWLSKYVRKHHTAGPAGPASTNILNQLLQVGVLPYQLPLASQWHDRPAMLVTTRGKCNLAVRRHMTSYVYLLLLVSAIAYCPSEVLRSVL